MKKILVSAVAVAALFGGSAVAADIPAKGPVYKAAPGYNWNGWYGGINAGYGWDPNYIFTTPGFAPVNLGIEPSGGFVGLQLGYNWQYARNWLIGIEADFQFANISDYGFARPGGGLTAINLDLGITHFATIRGRWGYVMDRSLIYITGGVAFAQFDVNLRIQYDVATGALVANNWETGYVLGAGWEYAFANNWTFKIEYQYLDFSFLYSGTASNGDVFTLAGDPQIHTIRFGLNRRFAGFLQP